MTARSDNQPEPADLPEERSIFDPGDDFEILPAEDNDPGQDEPDENVDVEKVAALSEVLKNAPVDLIRRRRHGTDEEHESVAALTDYSDEDIARAQIILTAADYAGWSHPLSNLSPETRADLIELTGTYLATAYELIRLEID